MIVFSLLQFVSKKEEVHKEVAKDEKIVTEQKNEA